jgi:uncharacterized protein YkwD
MKISNQIILIIIVLVSIYLIKSDYKSIPSKILSYLQSEVGKPTVASDINNAISNINDSSTDQVKTVVVPGALVVPDDYLTRDTKNIKLTAKGVIDITNKERANNGNLPALTENSKLAFSAEKKLQDMFVKGYFEHVSPVGVGVGDLGNQVGYEYIIIGENLALGNFKDNQSLVTAWMNSPGHRANILNNKYTEIGVAVGQGNYKGNSVWMSVQHFGLPKSACPSIDNVLKGIIEIDQKDIKTMEEDLSDRRIRIDSGAVSEGMTTSEQITKFNILVNEYNKLISDVKLKINEYNTQVRDFNECIAKVN